jgi:hypothetical protein
MELGSHRLEIVLVGMARWLVAAKAGRAGGAVLELGQARPAAIIRPARKTAPDTFLDDELTNVKHSASLPMSPAGFYCEVSERGW